MNTPDPIAKNNRDMITIHRNKAEELGYKVWGWSPALDPNNIYQEAGVPEKSERAAGVRDIRSEQSRPIPRF